MRASRVVFCASDLQVSSCPYINGTYALWQLQQSVHGICVYAGADSAGGLKYSEIPRDG